MNVDDLGQDLRFRKELAGDFIFFNRVAYVRSPARNQQIPVKSR